MKTPVFTGTCTALITPFLPSGAIAETAASYDHTSSELAENCPVVTNGVYVGMFFSSHYDDMVAAFQNALA